MIHAFCEEPHSILHSCSCALWWLVDIRAAVLMKSVEVFHHPVWTYKAVFLQVHVHRIQSFFSSCIHWIEACDVFQEMSHRSWDSACLSFNFPHYVSTGALMALNLSRAQYKQHISYIHSPSLFPRSLPSLFFSGLMCCYMRGGVSKARCSYLHCDREQIDRNWKLLVIVCAISDTVQTEWSVSIFASIFTLTCPGCDCMSRPLF